jgi:hypothetical protein
MQADARVPGQHDLDAAASSIGKPDRQERRRRSFRRGGLCCRRVTIRQRLSPGAEQSLRQSRAAPKARTLGPPAANCRSVYRRNFSLSASRRGPPPAGEVLLLMPTS